MKILKFALIAIVIIAVGFSLLNSYIYNEKQGDETSPVTSSTFGVEITPISHATMVMQWDNTTIYTDPVGGVEAFVDQPAPDLILITDIHGDHLNVDTLEAIVGPETVIFAPQAVLELLPAVPGLTSEPLASRAVVLNNGDTFPFGTSFMITAVPMYNLPESDDARHTKGRGNGYVIQNGDTRVYVAGDTAGTPEMRALQDIDIAFVPMNLPYTMGVEEAADAVVAFKPKIVYPYHYRGQDGLADIDLFQTLVNQNDPAITVELRDWYPAT